MSQNISLNEIRAAIGYSFRSPALITTAFTHPSFDGADNNLSLVFLGERLLELAIADHIVSHNASLSEKGLSERLERTKKALEYQNFISEHSLSGSIRLSPANEKLRESRELHGRIFLAITAAIYKDGGLPSLKSFLLPLLRATDDSEHYTPKVFKTQSADADSDAAFEAIFSATTKRAAPKRNVISDAIASVEKSSAKDADKAKKPEREKDAPSEKPERKGGIFKALRLSKERRSSTETENVKAQRTEVSDTESAEPKRSFIRDALSPVSLPESMRTAGYKNQYKKNPAENASEHNTKNAKACLQEYVQKKVRAASVTLSYSTEKCDGGFISEVSLAGNVLAKGEGISQKLAEQNAASLAYEEIKRRHEHFSPVFEELRRLRAEDTSQKENYVSRLNEHFQKQYRSANAPITYVPRRSEDKKIFGVAVIFNGEELATGTGASLREARQDAAKKLCESLNI